MKRSFGNTLEVIGLIVMLVLLIVAVLFFRETIGEKQSSIDTLPPYPIDTRTRLLPQRTDENLGPTNTISATTKSTKPTQDIYLTITSLAYPPPVTFTPNKTSTPTVVTITPILPTSMPTTIGSLPEGLKFVYCETEYSSGTSTIWVADISLKTRKLLNTLVNKAGYAITGAVSPDGKKLAYMLISTQSNEQDARIKGGSLWVMNTDGSNPHLVTSEVANFIDWSPNSEELAFSRYKEMDKPVDPQIPLQTNIYSINADGKNQKLLLSDNTSYGIFALGWSENGEIFYYTAVTLQKQWLINNIDTVTDQVNKQLTLNYQIVTNISLSPNHKDILFSAYDAKGQYSLSIQNLENEQKLTMASGAKGDQPESQYHAIWSPDSRQLLAHLQNTIDFSSELVNIEISTDQITSIIKGSVSGKEFFIPQSWSPDGKMAIILQYPRPQSLAYLLNLEDFSYKQLPLENSLNWITIFGWISQN